MGLSGGKDCIAVFDETLGIRDKSKLLFCWRVAEQ